MKALHRAASSVTGDGVYTGYLGQYRDKFLHFKD